MRRLALLLALFATSAQAWPLPINNGNTASAANSATITITTLVDSPVGSEVTCFIANNSTTGSTGVADTAGNTWSLQNQQTTNGRSRFARAPITVDLPIGATITITYAAANTNPKLAACATIFDPTNPTPDQNPTATTGSSTAPSITGAAPVQTAEIVFGGVLDVSGAGDVFTDPAGWTTLTGNSSTGQIHWAYYFACNINAATYNPTINNSRAWGANLVSYRMPMQLSIGGAGVC